MKLIIAFLIIGSFAILKTSAVPICVCPRISSQYVRQFQVNSLPREKDISKSENDKHDLLAIDSGDKDKGKPEKAGDDSRVGARQGKSLSHPSRVFSGAESSQPEYVYLDDMSFLYGNYQR